MKGVFVGEEIQKEWEEKQLVVLQKKFLEYNKTLANRTPEQRASADKILARNGKRFI